MVPDHSRVRRVSLILGALHVGGGECKAALLGGALEEVQQGNGVASAGDADEEMAPAWEELLQSHVLPEAFGKVSVPSGLLVRAAHRERSVGKEFEKRKVATPRPRAAAAFSDF